MLRSFPSLVPPRVLREARASGQSECSARGERASAGIMMSNFEPGIVAYLQRITEVCGPSTPPRSLAERRDNFDRRCAVWRRPPPATLEVRDWSVTLPGREIPVRLYRRKDVASPPVIVYLHGGGFVNGSIDTHDTVTWSLAEATGALVVSVQYRRPPENPFPAATDDSLAALDWVRHSAEFLKADVTQGL